MNPLVLNILCGYLTSRTVLGASTGSISSSGSASASLSSLNKLSVSNNNKNIENIQNSNDNIPCNLNEPWLCTEYDYYESHTCTLNNVCIFNEYAFLESGEFSTKMTHHCSLLPFDCNYFHDIKQCRSRYCATQTLCNLDIDGYEICLIKALLCYDEYCEPDLSALPFDYRLYDLCCHINDIKIDGGRFENKLVIILSIIVIVICIALYQIYYQFKKNALKKFCNTLYKKLKYFIKYMNKHYISMKIMKQNMEYLHNEIGKKCKKMRRNIKYQYKNNKMMWCFFNLFDDYFIKFQDSNIGQLTIPYLSFNIVNNSNTKQKHTDVSAANTDETNTNIIQTNTNNNSNNNNKKNNKSSNSNKKKRKSKDNNSNKKRKKSKSKKRKQFMDNKCDKIDTNTESEPATEVIINEYSESENNISNINNYTCDDDEKDLSDTSYYDSITMIQCSFCHTMNAQYLSYCDQCKNSLNIEKINTEKKDNRIDTHTKKVNTNKKNNNRKKNRKSKSKKKDNRHKSMDNNKHKSMDNYWTCNQCTYHNQIKHNTCQMCNTYKSESKFSNKSSKKYKKKKSNSNDKCHKQTHHIILNTSNTKKRIPPLPNNTKHMKTRDSNPEHLQNKSKNTLNPNAKEFIYNGKPNHSNNNNSNNNSNYSYQSYNCHNHSPHSPSRRLSKIPRLQKSVNPEPDYSPRKIYNNEYHNEYNEYNNEYGNEYSNEYNDTLNIPPRFQSPPIHNDNSNTNMCGEGERGEICETLNTNGNEIYPSNINITLIPPPIPPPPPIPIANITVPTDVIMPSVPPATTTTTATAALPQIPTTDLQKQLSDMEANVQEQLQVLDSLFPAIKPDLSQDIQNMQESIAMNSSI